MLRESCASFLGCIAFTALMTGSAAAAAPAAAGSDQSCRQIWSEPLSSWSVETKDRFKRACRAWAKHEEDALQAANDTCEKHEVFTSDCQASTSRIADFLWKLTALDTQETRPSWSEAQMKADAARKAQQTNAIGAIPQSVAMTPDQVDAERRARRKAEVLASFDAASPAFTNANAGGQESEPDAARLDVEAKRQADIVWSKYLVKCGDSYVHVDAGTGRFTEYRNASIRFHGSADGISEEDRLNGVEWWGYTDLDTALERDSESDGWFSGKQIWGKWYYPGVSVPGFHLRKVKNVWTTLNDSDEDVPVADMPSVKTACSEVPK
jgi:hypothetical protein